MKRTAATVRCCSLLASLCLAGTAAAWPNPANDPRVLNQPIEDSTYDTAHRCRPRTTPGIRLLTGWIDRHFPGESWGVYRCERLDKDSRSLHSEGRALDWHLDARDKRSRRAANFLIERLLATDALGNTNALARRMGVQEIIFNCRSWFSGSDGLGPYSACADKHVDRTTAHRDHVHIGLNLQGAAAKTSFWKSGLGKR
jgi:hypothetical protein